MAQRIAVVTGGNKGIGYEIIKALSKTHKARCILAARDASRGKDAVQKLKDDGAQNVEFHQLDISDKNSIQSFVTWAKDTLGGLDIVVNNAGFAYKHDATEAPAQQARDTVGTNFFGTCTFTKAILPLMKDEARIVNVGSQAGLLSNINNGELHKKLLSDNLTIEELEKLMQEYVDAVAAGQHKEKGWPDSTYSASKIGVQMMTRILPKALPSYTSAKDVTVNVMCPGWCKSDMAGWEKPPRTAEQGADTAVWLATLPKDDKRTGRFFYEKQERDW